MIEKLISFVKAEWNHVVNSMFIQNEYEVKEKIAELEKKYQETNSEIIWLMLEEKKKILARIQKNKRLREEN